MIAHKEKGKPNCYKCIHRRSLPGDAHSSCDHPKAGKNKNPLGSMMAIFASVGKVNPTINFDGAKKLNIQAHSHGVKRGWFNWPYNFDPVWLVSCDGFSSKEVV